LAGAGKLWFEGLPFYLEDLLSIEENNRTPINVINVSGMSFEDQSFVISHVTFSIYLWMKRQGGSQDPRLLFCIDEIGAGGGSLAFYPSHPHNPPSKPGINLLVRQGRSFGVCCLLATQSPGDIDYKGLGQCQTWIVGRLQREREIKKVEEGASSAEIDFKGKSKFIPSLGTGEFLVKRVDGRLDGLRERWLYSFHKSLSLDDVSNIKKSYESGAYISYAEAKKLQDGGDYRAAAKCYRAFKRKFRHSARYAESLLNLGGCLFALREFDESLEILKQLERKSYDQAILSEAWLLSGKCLREKAQFEDAEKRFDKAYKEAEQMELKKEAFIWRDYCRQAGQWLFQHVFQRGTPQLRLWFPEAELLPPLLAIPEAVTLNPHSDSIEFEELPPRLPADVVQVPSPISVRHSSNQLVDSEAAVKTKQSLIEMAEQELRQKRARVRARALSDLQKATQKQAAGEMVEAKKLYDRIAGAYNSDGLEPEPDVWREIESFNREVAKRELMRLQVIERLDGRSFEIQVARLFNDMGYKVKVTTRNGGVDVWAFREERKVVIQCKHWSGPVGPDVVRELNGSRHRTLASEAIIVTSSTFTQAAIAEALQAGIRLIDGIELGKLYGEFYRTNDDD
jgi:restriction endonuclease Mrr/TolA-binding protein